MVAGLIVVLWGLSRRFVHTGRRVWLRRLNDGSINGVVEVGNVGIDFPGLFHIQ